MPKRVWTEGDNPQELTQDSIWHVRIPPDAKVMVCKIVALTSKTVTLMEMPFSHIKRHHEINRINFIERESEGDDE